MNLSELEKQVEEIKIKKDKLKALEEMKKEDDFRVGFDFSGIRETVLKKVRAYVESVTSENELKITNQKEELKKEINLSIDKVQQQIKDTKEENQKEKEYLKKELEGLKQTLELINKKEFKAIENKIKAQEKLINSEIIKAKDVLNLNLKTSLVDTRRSFAQQLNKQALKPHRIQDHVDSPDVTGQLLNRLTKAYSGDFVDDLHKHNPAPIIEEVSKLFQNAILNIPSSSFRLDVGDVGESLYEGIREIRFRDANVINKGGGRVEIDTVFNPEVNYIDFNTAATSAAKVGRLRWNNTDRCLEYDSEVDGDVVTNQIGQETWIRVRNNTGVIIANGKPVYVTGAVGNRPTIALAKADSLTTCLTYLGITTQSIGINEDGFVTVRGSVRGVDTNAFTAGNILYLSATTAGGLTETRPVAPNNVIAVGICTVKSGDGEIGIDSRIIPNLSRLSDVYVSAIADGHVLQWDGTDLRWENKALSSIDHGSLGGLTDDDHTQYAYLAGRAGSQSLYGGTAASEELNLFSTSHATRGNIVIGRQSMVEPISYATSISSEILALRSWNYTGSASQINNFTLQSIASTTANTNTLTLKYGATSILEVASNGVVTSVSGYMRVEAGASGTGFTANSIPNFYLRNSNSTVNNYTSIINRNQGNMYTAGIVFRNLSHNGTTGSADLEFWLANGAAATNLFKMEAAGHLTVLTDSGKVYWGAGKDFSAYYNGTSAYLKTDEVAASDLHVTTGTAKTIVYDTPVYDDLNFDPTRSGGPAATRPDDVTINNVIHKEFTSSNNQLCGAVSELPHKYKLSGTLTPHIHIFLKNGESAGTTGVTFTFYWELRQSTGTTSGSLTLAATTANLGTTAGANMYTISGTAFAGSAELGGQLAVTIARTAGDAGDVVVTSYGVHYPMDTPGSRDITTK